MKTPVTVITGFLGAGKTTLLRHLLTHAAGRRIAVIINEFGDLGVDRELLLGCGIAGCGEDDLVELPNGCICCTVADAFLPTIERLLHRVDPPDHIVIETSGLALPKPLIKAFDWPEVRSRATVDAVVAVVDAAAVAAGQFDGDGSGRAGALAGGQPVDHESPLEELFEDQVLAADLVVLNKTDLVDPTMLAAVRGRVGVTARPATKVIPARHGGLDLTALLGVGAAAEDDLAARPSHHDAPGPDDDHGHDEFESFVVELAAIADPAVLERRLSRVLAEHDVLRVKGFLDVPDKAMRHVVQAVGPRIQRYYDRPWQVDEARLSRLVVIGRSPLDQAAVQAALAG
ncbi:MAG: cobalamin biosynthesis protein CobW [Rhodospirillales bacterium]|nr:MAG: cobalamin biosynthesis protein CobW [Rhodospirillales bacterium]